MGEGQQAAAELATFGAGLSRCRVAAGLTQEELAERAGLSVEAISTLERGVVRKPRASTLRQLLDALQLSPDERLALEQAARSASPAQVEDIPPVGSFLGALPATEMVGREAEVERISSTLAAVAEDAGHFLLLSGEFGVGKTRLLQEIMVEARNRGYLVLTGRCYRTEQTNSLSPLMDALSDVDMLVPVAVRADWQRGWKRIRALFSAGRREPTEGAREAQQEIYTAVADLLASVARAVPIALLVDDLQWADDEALKLLAHVARATRTVPILVAGAFLDHRLTEEHPALAETLQIVTRERLAERLIVRRLSLEETTQLVAILMGKDESVSDEFAHFVYRRTKGIPRLIDQLIRSMGGRLELQGEIGAGAMGRVFRAFDRSLKKMVAAKLVLARKEIDLDTLLRFQQEGAVLAALSHPHIVEIYDSFAEEHASCIIMELLEGKSLGKILQDDPLPLARAKHLVQQVAEALSYAHSQGIVHRDIKPDNVMVRPGDQVKVTDFGIARILQPETSLQTMATTGMRMGTPLYMAPEQIEGKKIDARTDIYALGAMLYHMVTGRPPFEGSDVLAVAVKHLQEEPIPPSQLDPAIPVDWDAVILKAMAKDPAKRFQSAEEMKTAITALSEHAASETGTTRRPWPLAVVAGAIALAAVLAGVWIHSASGSQHPAPAAGIDAYLTQHHFSGYILLERHGHVLLSKGYGAADKNANLPNTIRSKWPVLGAGKLMMAIAVLKLQGEHKLSVRDYICRYITGCPQAWRLITIRELLLDTAGLGTFDTAASPGGVTQAIARCTVLPVGLADAATRDSVCNTLLLGRVIASASGKPWPAAMQRLVFGPAHMTDSGVLNDGISLPGRVLGYFSGRSLQLGNYNNDYIPYASIRDLERLDRALLAGRLLSPRALHTLITPHVSGGAVLERYYGLGSSGSNATQLSGGYQVYLRGATKSTVTVADKPGITGGIGLDNAFSPDDGTIAIVARNNDASLDPTSVLFGLAAHLMWSKQTSVPPLIGPHADQIASYLTKARFHGYVYLERHGRVILSKAFGKADVEDKVPSALQTKWPAFGLTRFLVALAIMKLQDEGKLSVHDRICRYVTGCPAAWRTVTIDELLTGTSGIDSYDPFVPGVTPDQMMSACRTLPLLFKPGSYSSSVSSPWSDCNTLLMDMALQKLTGKPWETAMQALVYRPAHMTHTGQMTDALKPPQRGRLYRGGFPTPELNYDGFYLAYTTVEDIIRLNHTLLADRVISKKALDAIFNSGLRVDPHRGYEVIVNWLPALSPRRAVPHYPTICESCVNGGGEDDEGNQAGFFMTVSMSRGADAIQIEINNDSAMFNPGDNDNAFAAFIGEELYGK